MVFKRIIPVLLFKNDGLVKTVKFKKPNYIGDPINAVKIFNEKEVDEIIILDIDASKNNQGPNFDLLNSLASECFMPLTYGGGINSIQHLEKIFTIGVEKASINMSLIKKSFDIKYAIESFGSSSLVASINIKRDLFNKYRIYDYSSRKKIKVSISDFIKSIEDIGFGEILVSDVDRDGTFLGLDNDLINTIVNSVDVPVVFNGGASTHMEISNTLNTIPGLSGIAAGSAFVYHGIHKAVLINYTENDERFRI
jgi:imidazole glycerol-phosphate synthase subunit HisF